MSKLNVKGIEITVIVKEEINYISLTDMVKAKEGVNHIQNWMRNRNTIEFIGLWEELNNPNFKGIEFDTFRKEAGLNAFTMTPQKWINATNAIGIFSKSGKNGGTYAHKDIAYQFGMWLSPVFQLLLIKEFDRLKQEEQKRLGSEWDYRRFLAKTNYVIHTDAIKNYVIPVRDIEKDKEKWVYAEEGDILNTALFGYTAKQWKEANPAEALKGLNMRDLADAHQLLVLSNLESINAKLIFDGKSKYDRLLELRKVAIEQLKSLRNSSYTLDKIQSPFKHSDNTNVKALNEENNTGYFDELLTVVLKVTKPEKDVL